MIELTAKQKAKLPGDVVLDPVHCKVVDLLLVAFGKKIVGNLCWYRRGGVQQLNIRVQESPSITIRLKFHHRYVVADLVVRGPPEALTAKQRREEWFTEDVRLELPSCLSEEFEHEGLEDVIMWMSLASEYIRLRLNPDTVRTEPFDDGWGGVTDFIGFLPDIRMWFKKTGSTVVWLGEHPKGFDWKAEPWSLLNHPPDPLAVFDKPEEYD